jgi:hypothetical protein
MAEHVALNIAMLRRTSGQPDSQNYCGSVLTFARNLVQTRDFCFGDYLALQCLNIATLESKMALLEERQKNTASRPNIGINHDNTAVQ